MKFTVVFIFCFFSIEVFARQEIVISTASSITEVVQQVSLLFYERSQIKVNINTASSGILANQIKKGALVDIFISADEQWINYLDKQNIFVEVRYLCSNRLVILVSDRCLCTITSLQKLKLDRFKKIAVGNPDFVPLGKYTLQSFKSVGILEDLNTKIVYTSSARNTVEYLNKNIVDAAVIYYTDTFFMKKRNSLYIIPTYYHNKIKYWVSIVENNKVFLSEQFVNFLDEQEVKEIFRERGFVL